MKRLPELLAPAGSPEALIAALAAGADAVYLSGKRFGARKFAANFDETALAKAIDYCHLRGAKVYVTVNTLIRDDELFDVAKYLLRLYEMGTDAVLIQDLGVAALARQLVPDLELHASTQMTIHNREGAVFAARIGFKRVVLAREVTLDEIKEMENEMKASGPGLEIFVHGALCYCYSGQCLLSSAIGGRSGNRGMCAQPCRKPYVLLRGEKDEYGRSIHLMAEQLKEKFLISTRDLSIYRHLDRIVSVHLQSLKIEGRMKSPEYVAIVTSIYRKALDGIRKGSWSPSPDDERDLALAFNRDFTEGHLLNAKDVMGRQMSDNRGIFIGSVTSYDIPKGEATVRLSGHLVPEEGDGLVFLAPGQELGLVVHGSMLKDGLIRLRTPERVRPGTKVFLTSSSVLDQKAQKIIASAKTEIPIDLSITWENETPIAEARLEKGLRIQVRAGFEHGDRKESACHKAADRGPNAKDWWNAFCHSKCGNGLSRRPLRFVGGPEPIAARCSGKSRRGTFKNPSSSSRFGRCGPGTPKRDETHVPSGYFGAPCPISGGLCRQPGNGARSIRGRMQTNLLRAASFAD